jgi:CRISPR-associated protein Cmr4
MSTKLVNLYLLSPLHTGAVSQAGNEVSIARETHTNFPYIPSSSIRGRLRAYTIVDVDRNDEDARIEAKIKQVKLFGPDLNDLKDNDFLFDYEVETDIKLTQLQQGNIWIGDASILWYPVSSLSHGIIWISCPLLLQRWARFVNLPANNIPEYAYNGTKEPLYLKDAIIPSNSLQPFTNWNDYIPQGHPTSIDKVLVLPNQHCETLIQMSLWRQVKVKLDEHKVVDGGSFRYEEAISPDALMYFPWGTTLQSNADLEESINDFEELINSLDLLQIGGQESLGRGFAKHWITSNTEQIQNQEEA